MKFEQILRLIQLVRITESRAVRAKNITGKCLTTSRFSFRNCLSYLNLLGEQFSELGTGLLCDTFYLINYIRPLNISGIASMEIWYDRLTGNVSRNTNYFKVIE